MIATPRTANPSATRTVGRIPIRNIWLLFLYASDLAQFQGRFQVEIEESPDLPELIARLLCFAVERRCRRNLSRGYKQEKAVLTRVRGGIDALATISHDLLRRGAVACRYENHTVDTVRNRLVRAALSALAPLVLDKALAHQCRRLANELGQQGVGGIKPSRGELSADQIGRHDAEDRLMVSLARLVFELGLPTDDDGADSITGVDRNEILVRRLFEKAVANFLKIELRQSDEGWAVFPGRRQYWQIDPIGQTARIPEILPNMITDIVLENHRTYRRIIIDTKFTDIFTSSTYREKLLKSGYVYQLYAYLRSQERTGDPLSTSAEGILLHPAIDENVDERLTIQGHRMRFMTVDLAGKTPAILTQLRGLVVEHMA